LVQVLSLVTLDDCVEFSLHDLLSTVGIILRLAAH
jgi:hypothetical protein